MVEAAGQTQCRDILVYLVDDDRGMVTATSQWLSLSGLKVRAFADPAALIKVLKPNQPCVVISDIRMPGIDGMELMKLIHGKDHRIPVILITGHGDIPLAVEAMKSGAFEFIPKPFSPDDLLKVTKLAQDRWMRVLNEQDVAASAIGQAGAKEESAVDEGSQQTENLSDQVDGFEKELIEGALRRHRGSIPKVLDELAIPRRTLNAKMKKHGILRADFR